MAEEATYHVSADPTGPTEAQIALEEFWPKVNEDIKHLETVDFRNQDLPLARIKKIMKLDEDVKMISAEAPLLFAKAAEIFISELSLRAWIHTEENKRRTLQRNDIALAVSKYDQFDFLIDIVPRDEGKPVKRESSTTTAADQVQYYFQYAAGAPGTATSQALGAAGAGAAVQVAGVPGHPAQTLQIIGATAGVQGAASSGNREGSPAGTQGQPVAAQSSSAAGPVQQAQVFQQVVTSTGELQNVPVHLSESQMQAIRLQMQGKQAGQPIIIQAQAGVGIDQITQNQQAASLLQQAAGGATYFQQHGEGHSGNQ